MTWGVPVTIFKRCEARHGTRMGCTSKCIHQVTVILTQQKVYEYDLTGARAHPHDLREHNMYTVVVRLLEFQMLGALNIYDQQLVAPKFFSRLVE